MIQQMIYFRLAVGGKLSCQPLWLTDKNYKMIPGLSCTDRPKIREEKDVYTKIVQRKYSKNVATERTFQLVWMEER